MGLQRDYFYSLTPRTFANIQEGYNQRVDTEFKDNWQRTRKLMFAMLKPHLKNNQTSETDLFPFPWEEAKPDEEIVTTEQAQEILKQQQDYWNNIDKKRKEGQIKQVGKWQV